MSAVATEQTTLIGQFGDAAEKSPLKVSGKKEHLNEIVYNGVSN